MRNTTLLQNINVILGLFAEQSQLTTKEESLLDRTGFKNSWISVRLKACSAPVIQKIICKQRLSFAVNRGYLSLRPLAGRKH